MVQVIIVEDESILRQGIINLIDWKSLGCEIAADFSTGEAAFSWLLEHPADLLITDIKMPGMSGLDLIRAAKQSCPYLQFILLTAYADFEYAKTAISLGVSNYIIKSNFYDELPLAINRIVNGTQAVKRESKLSQEIKSFVFSALKEQVIHEPHEISHILSQYNIQIHRYCIILASLYDLKSEKYNFSSESCHQAVENLFCLALQDFTVTSVWLPDNDFLVIVNCPQQKSKEEIQNLLIIACNQILSTVTGYMPFSTNIGISDLHCGAASFSLACGQAQDCLATMLDENCMSLYSTSAGARRQALIHEPQFWLNHMLQLLPPSQEWDSDLLPKAVKSMLSEYHTAYPNFHQLKMELLQLINRLFLFLAESSIDEQQLISLESSAYQHIMKAPTLQAVFTQITALLQKLHAHEPVFYQSRSSIVRDIDEIISKKYTENLRLDDIASQLNMNISYLCRVYKKETGHSIISALNQYRISKSKELLNNNDLRISEIGYMVGITDPSYFTSVFTRHVGISPQKYREMCISSSHSFRK